MFNIYFNNDSKDWLDVLGILGQIIVPIIVLIISTLYTNFRNNNLDKQFSEQIEMQKEQWLRDEFIKNEARKIIEFRDIYFKASDSVMWLINNLFSPKYFCNCDICEQDKFLFVDVINKHYQESKKVIDFYFKNQMIFKKYNIGIEIEYISILLEIIATNLTDCDYLEFNFIRQDGTQKEYKHNKYQRLINFFVTGMDIQIFQMENNFVSDDLKNKISQLDFNDKLNEYKNMILSSVIGLEFKLEKLTLVNYKDIPEQLRNIQKRTMLDSLK